MKGSLRRSRPFWRVADPRIPRLELWIVAAVLLAMMLMDVWQSSRVTQLCRSLDQNRAELRKVQVRLESGRLALEQRSTPSQLAPLAAQLGLVPVQEGQIVILPAEYLADDAVADLSADAARQGTPAERLMRALVPDARALGRAKD